MIGLDGRRLGQPIARGERVEVAQQRQTLGVEARRLRVRRQRRADAARLLLGDLGRAELLAQLVAGARHDLEELRVARALAGGGDGLAGVGLLQAQIEPHAPAGAFAQQQVRAVDDEIGADAIADALQRRHRDGVAIAQPHLEPHARDIVGRDDAQIGAGGDLGDQHFAERRREPGGVGAAGQVLQAEHGDDAATARARSRCRLGRRGSRGRDRRRRRRVSAQVIRAPGGDGGDDDGATDRARHPAPARARQRHRAGGDRRRHLGRVGEAVGRIALEAAPDRLLPALGQVGREPSRRRRRRVQARVGIVAPRTAARRSPSRT